MFDYTIVCHIEKSGTRFNEVLAPYYLNNLEISKKISDKECYIWLYRHGESESNAKSASESSADSKVDNKSEIRIAGRVVDSPLTKGGIKQAAELGKLFKDKKIHFSAFYFSPLDRAKQTAATIQKVMDSKQKLIEDKRFLETWYGDLEGANGYKYDGYEAKMKDELPKLPSFEARMDYRMVDNMESNKEVYNRVTEAIVELAKEHMGQTISITSHNGPLKAIFMHLMARDWMLDVPYHTFSVGNCAALGLKYDGQKITMIAIHNIFMRASKSATPRSKL